MPNHIDVKIRSQFLARKLNECHNILRNNGKRIAGLIFFNTNLPVVVSETESNLWFAIAVWGGEVPEKLYYYNGSTRLVENLSQLESAHKIFCRNQENDDILVSNSNVALNPDLSSVNPFDFVFITIEQFSFAAGIWFGSPGSCSDNTIFPTNKLIDFSIPDGEFIVCPRSYGYYQTSIPQDNDIYCQITYAFIVLDYFEQNQNGDRNRILYSNPFRTLKFNPYIEPALSNTSERPAIAYELGTPCPPMWKPYLQNLEIRTQYEFDFPGIDIPQQFRKSLFQNYC
jgi:hypothetical protein